MKIKSIRFSMLRTTKQYENDRAECEVELGPKDSIEAAFATAIDVCNQGLGMSPDTKHPYRADGPLSRGEINRIKARALSRPIDLGPFGGVETFVASSETTIPRDVLAELCDLAAKAKQ